MPVFVPLFGSKSQSVPLAPAECFYKYDSINLCRLPSLIQSLFHHSAIGVWNLQLKFLILLLGPVCIFLSPKPPQVRVTDLILLLFGGICAAIKRSRISSVMENFQEDSGMDSSTTISVSDSWAKPIAFIFSS